MGMASKPTQPTEHVTAEDFIFWTKSRLFYRGRVGFSEAEVEGHELLRLCLMSDSDVPPGGSYFRTGQNDLDLNACLSNVKMDEAQDREHEKLIHRCRVLSSQAGAIMDQRIDEEIPNRGHAQILGAHPTLTAKLRLLSEMKPLYSGIFTVHILRYYENHSSHRLGKKDARTFRLSFETPFDRFLSRLRVEALAFLPSSDGRCYGYTLRDGPWYYRKFQDDVEDGNVRKKLLPQIRAISESEDYELFLKALKKGNHNKVIFWHEMTPKAPGCHVNNPIARDSLVKKAAVIQTSPLQDAKARSRQAEKTRYEDFPPSITEAKPNLPKRPCVEESRNVTNVSNKRQKMGVESPSELYVPRTIEKKASLTEALFATSQSTGSSSKNIIPDHSLEAWIQDTDYTKLDEPLDELGNPYFDRPYDPDAFRLGKHKQKSPWAYNPKILD